MSKADFFMQLQERLRGLPYEERRRIIEVYEELFRQAEQNGKSEREIIESLGFVTVPMSAAAPVAGSPGYGRSGPVRSGVRSVFAAIALLLFNLIFVLGPFVGLASVLFTLSLTSLLFTFSAIWVAVGTGAPDTFTLLLIEICSILVLTGGGILLGAGMWRTNRFFVGLLKRYIRLNLKLIRGE